MKHLRKFNEQSIYFGDIEEVIIERLIDFNHDIKDALCDIIDEFDLTLYQDQVYSHSARWLVAGVPETHLYPSILFYRRDYTMLEIIKNDSNYHKSFEFSFNINSRKLELTSENEIDGIKEMMNLSEKYRMVLEVYPLLIVPKQSLNIYDFNFNSIDMIPHRQIYGNWKRYNRKMEPDQLNTLEKELMKITPNIKSQIGDFKVDIVSHDGEPEIIFNIYIPLT